MDKTQDQIFGTESEPAIFAVYANPARRVYDQINNFVLLKEYIVKKLSELNLNHIILFTKAIEHITRVSRILGL